jgi:hypothetical protein
MHIHLKVSAFLVLLFHLFPCSALSVTFMPRNTARNFMHSVWVHIKIYFTVLDLRLSQWWCWGFRSSAMWCCVTGWVILVILKELAHWHSISFQNAWILYSVLVYIEYTEVCDFCMNHCWCVLMLFPRNVRKPCYVRSQTFRFRTDLPNILKL